MISFCIIKTYVAYMSNLNCYVLMSCHVVWRVLRGARILKRDILLVRARLRVHRALVTRKESVHMKKSCCTIASRTLRVSCILRGDTTLMERRLRVPHVFVIRDDGIKNDC